MSRKVVNLTDDLYNYLVQVGAREHPVLQRLRTATAAETGDAAGMQIAPDQGALMAMLVRLLGARRTLEAGTFTGYSALAVALALPDDGRLVACDVSEQWTAIARRFWTEAGVAHKIDLRLAPAIQTMDALLAAGEAGHFDFAFLDAEKVEYDAYYERSLKLLRPGGVVAVDNVLWSGRVADPKVTDANTRAIRALNEKIRTDARVDVVLVPVADGLFLARKRG
ncbi:MAG: SAM-dependent methyltransferase [Alphaproteobacteria bacterium]|nr:SAM-dependent methyltransferase [Alphaproteobacteria bacterium]